MVSRETIYHNGHPNQDEKIKLTNKALFTNTQKDRGSAKNEKDLDFLVFYKQYTQAYPHKSCF